MADTLTTPAEWPSTARAVAEATDAGIRAARTQHIEDFRDAAERLEKHAEVAREVHEHMVRELLETMYQDGLTGDDVSDVLRRTITGAGLWDAQVDPSAVVVVLTGALGVAETSDDRDAGTPDVAPTELIGAAILVMADLLAAGAMDRKDYLLRAVEEIRRAQTVEMP
ncbi:hypothetical protein QSJ19_22545 [Gordonia sp. ABSL11-1]|uniref:hypothetical protein n=1 Tax=Gordonia sp. ABSL11-1 TaxID=3053924 RepID=UPI0025722B94|nr:hypothetical protein [Gordonia sp. ABSL11-1]MDL9948306.1 hypothetical protein [Gordonia sp. ABSL11-1]